MADLNIPSHEMRVLVTGGRNYQDRAAVFHALDLLANTHIAGAGNEFIIVIHGACCEPGQPLKLRGADRWADEWAKEREYPHIAVPAQWGRFDKAAGPHRNRDMLDRFKPTNVVAFPGGTGTSHMIDIAQQAGLAVWQPIADRPRRSIR